MGHGYIYRYNYLQDRYALWDILYGNVLMQKTIRLVKKIFS